MPTETPFVYPHSFSPAAHCVESKTSTELDSLAPNRWEGTLSEVMALWWNLHQVDITVAVAGNATSTVTSIGMSTSGVATGTLTPRERMCASDGDEDHPYAGPMGDGTVDVSDFDDTGIGTGEGAYVVFEFQRVYYNTTESKYALKFLFLFGLGPAGNLVCTPGWGDSNGTPGTTNGGTITFLGQTVPSNRVTGANVSITFASPVYYTY